LRVEKFEVGSKNGTRQLGEKLTGKGVKKDFWLAALGKKTKGQHKNYYGLSENPKVEGEDGGKAQSVKAKERGKKGNGAMARGNRQ